MQMQDNDKSVNVRETNPAGQGDAESEALKQARQEAYDRYLSNYERNYKRIKRKTKVSKPIKVLSGIYVVSLALFLISLASMNVLPLKWLIAVMTVVALLSALVLSMMYKKRINKLSRRLAAFIGVFLIFFYALGSVYALSTMTFLSATSEESEKKVRSVTEDTFHVVITGIDVEGLIDEPGRSDVNMVLTVNPMTHQLLMTSIPRDYQIALADKEGAVDKLTHTGYYGADSTMAAEGNLLDIEANYYVKINFTTVKKFVDAIGGIDVYSEYEFSPTNDWTVHVGMNHMNGEQALAFSRTRYAFEEGDRQRIKNQQAVFEAMFTKAISSPSMIVNYNSILSELKDYFKMSFSSKEIRDLVRKQLADNPRWRIYKNTITGGDAMMPTYSGGAQNLYVMTRDEKSLSYARAFIIAVTKGEDLEADENGMAKLPQTSSDSDEDKENNQELKED